MPMTPRGWMRARDMLPSSVEYCDDMYDAISEADAIVLMTEWNAYRGLDLERVKRTMRGDVFVDLRNVYEPQIMHRAGFVYVGVGR